MMNRGNHSVGFSTPGVFGGIAHGNSSSTASSDRFRVNLCSQAPFDPCPEDLVIRELLREMDNSVSTQTPQVNLSVSRQVRPLINVASSSSAIRGLISHDVAGHQVSGPLRLDRSNPIVQLAETPPIWYPTVSRHLPHRSTIGSVTHFPIRSCPTGQTPPLRQNIPHPEPACFRPSSGLSLISYPGSFGKSVQSSGAISSHGGPASQEADSPPRQKSHFRCALCPFTASKADRVYRHFTRSHSSAHRHSVDTLRLVPASEPVRGTVSGNVPGVLGPLRPARMSDPHLSPVKHGMSSSNQPSSTSANNSNHIQKIASTQTLPDPKPVSSLPRSSETRSDFVPASTSLLVQCLGISASCASDPFTLKQAEKTSTTHGALNHLSVRTKNDTVPNSPVNSPSTSAIMTDQSKEHMHSARIVLEPIGANLISALRPASTDRNVNSVNSPSQSPRNFAATPVTPTSSSDVTMSTTTISSVLTIVDPSNVESDAAGKTTNCREPLVNMNHNTDARHTNHLSDRSSSTNATADTLPPLVVTPTSSITSDPCSSHHAGSNLTSRGTARVNSSPISPISSFDEGDEDDLVFLGFTRKARTSLPSLCLKCGTNESASNCSKCSTIWNPPQRQVRRSDSGAYKRFRVHDTVSPSDSLRASKRLKQQSSRQATADESSKVVDKDNKDASVDVTTDVTRTLCDRASFVVPASEDLTNSVVPINGSTPTSSTSCLSSLGRHSSRKSPLQPIPTAPLEVVTVSPIGAGIQPADRITVDLFTGEVYVDNRPLRSLIGGMRLTRLIPWREEPSSRVRGGGRRGRVSGSMPSTRRKQGQSTKSVSHAAESKKTVQSHRASNSARGGRSRVSPVCSKTRGNEGSSHPPIRCGTKSRGKLRTRSAGTKKTFPLTTPIVNHNPLPGSANSVLPRVSRDNLPVTADCVNKGAAVFG